MSKRRSKSYKVPRNFPYGNRLQQLEVACPKLFLQPVCEIFPVKVVIPTFWHSVHQSSSKTFGATGEEF